MCRAPEKQGDRDHKEKNGREEEERRNRGWVGDKEMFRNDMIIQKKILK